MAVGEDTFFEFGWFRRIKTDQHLICRSRFRRAGTSRTTDPGICSFRSDSVQHRSQKWRLCTEFSSVVHPGPRRPEIPGPERGSVGRRAGAPRAAAAALVRKRPQRWAAAGASTRATTARSPQKHGFCHARKLPRQLRHTARCGPRCALPRSSPAAFECSGGRHRCALWQAREKRDSPKRKRGAARATREDACQSSSVGRASFAILGLKVVPTTTVVYVTYSTRFL